MGLSTALYNGVSGLLTISNSLNVIGDNLANVNTAGFKASNARFETVFSQTIAGASGPSGNLLGTNPIQVGLGSSLATITRAFTQGSLNGTGSLSDLAIQGSGFFILSNGEAQTFTRDGSFGLAVDGTLVDPATGLAVQGYQAVDGVVTPTGTVGNIVLPIGISIARETENALITGNFDASAEIATLGTVTDGPPVNGPGAVPATAGTALTGLEDLLGTNLGLAAGDIITLNATKGGADVTATGEVGVDFTNLGDLAAWLQTNLGIVGGSVVIDPVDGSFTITGDLGEGNAIEDVMLSAVDGLGVDRTDFNNVFSPGGTSPFTEITAAVGDSFSLSGLSVFDSLGNEIPLNITFTVTGIRTLEYLAESPAGVNVGSGTITYDRDGQFVSVTNDLIAIDTTATGALNPLDITLDFTNTTFLAGTTTLALSSQDGFPIGSLQEFYVDNNGLISGAFTNGLTQTLGQVALAVFSNEQGLLAIGDNQYFRSGNSGEPVIGIPGTGGRGTVAQGYLEGSNTDLATEFTNIIISQRGFQANARTITAADVLLEEVISLVR